MSTVPSPLKLMTSIMALGAVGLDPPGGVPKPVAVNTYVPLRSATVHRFVASETPGLFMGSRARSSAAMRTARRPLIVSPSCVSVDARATVTTGNGHGIGSPYRRRGLEARVSATQSGAQHG